MQLPRKFEQIDEEMINIRKKGKKTKGLVEDVQ